MEGLFQKSYSVCLSFEGAIKNYSELGDMQTPGSYAESLQYDFLDHEGNMIKSYEIYTLVPSFPAELLDGYPEVLLYDATENQWYLFNEDARLSINQQVESAFKYGFVKNS